MKKEGVTIWAESINDTDEDIEAQLKPCPFCGGKPYLFQFGNQGFGKCGFETGCARCRIKKVDATLTQPLSFLLPIVISDWNRRVK